MDPVIQMNGVSKRFGTQVALNKVSLEIPRGVVFALLGENGAGKTTALRILLGLIQPDEGSAKVLGNNSDQQGQAIRQKIGYVSERPTLYDWMTVDEIGWFAAGFYGDGYVKRYTQLCGRFSLPGEKKIKTLSKGARAKVSLSLALAHDPSLLILDEPTSGLDTLVRREFLESMVELAAEGKTVLLSSHQLSEVERVADIVAMLHHGELEFVERLEHFKDQTQEITITLADDGAVPPDIQGELLRTQYKKRQWQILSRNLSQDQLTRLQSHESVVSLQTRRPGLEEIFLAYLQRSAQAGEPSEIEEALL